MNVQEITLYQIVTFAILMENNEGIIGKSPNYIKEKFYYCMDETNPNYLESILSSSNQAKLRQWREEWIS